MDGQRKALIVANDEYEHEGLRHLLAPAADAEALAGVLGDSQIGDFDVRVVHNEPAHDIEAQIEDLFADSRPDDVLLLHFSCHGLKSESGDLFFAARNTRPNRLGSTAVSADFVQRCMRASRSRSIVLLLDCCYGGAFGQGVAVRAAGDVNVLDSFPGGKLGGGRGRAVITASSAMEYAFEGDRLADDHGPQPSVFTSALVEGLASGDADRDEDGWVSLNELYDYVFDRVREQNPHQTPSRDVEMQGELYLARSRRQRIRALPIPPDLQAAMTDPNMFTRLGAVAELRARLSSDNLPAAAGAGDALAEMARTEIQYVAEAAATALAESALRVVEPELHFGQVHQGSNPPQRTLHLLGPPLARACTVHTSHSWIQVDQTAKGIDVSVDTAGTGNLRGDITIKGALGEALIPVDIEVTPSPEHPSPQGGVEVDTVAAAVITDVEPPPATPVAMGLADLGTAQAEPAQPQPAQAGPAAEEPTPAHGIPAASAPPSRALWKFSGIAALVSGALMLLCIVLPQQYGSSTSDNDPIKAAYLLCLGLVVLSLGSLTLTARWRIQGLGGVIGAASVSTVVAFDMVNTLDSLGSADLGLGFWAAFVAPLVLLAAGVLAVAAARRETDAGLAALHVSDWTSWVVLVLALAGALILVPAAMDTFSSYPGWGLQGLWLAVLAVAVPLTAVLTRPVLLGRWLLLGWALACATLVLAIWMSWEDYDGSSHGMWFVMLTLAAMAGLAPIVHRSRT
jgi:hypothetical protein